MTTMKEKVMKEFYRLYPAIWINKEIPNAQFYIKETIQLTEVEKNREIAKFLADSSTIISPISKLNLMIMEVINDKELENKEKFSQISNITSGISNSLKLFIELYKDKLKEIEKLKGEK